MYGITLRAKASEPCSDAMSDDPFVHTMNELNYVAFVLEKLLFQTQHYAAAFVEAMEIPEQTTATLFLFSTGCLDTNVVLVFLVLSAWKKYNR